ncbi:phosphatase PAP2 family protein [Actinokineospora fastidiosa]|uniref:Phosphatidic acid phosphatase type 2/haloperoxidase domain-containing protein n=1 Tax=Actinokineospora fastidiosa TaxID=1816 RepID=A0A918LHI7_9PSEU|nr:phosphatase PAP2 family protein [Actinokineospora fastidiosa]GGS50204.1 hypothetical protein GCM10010171_51710 [Actinokineospora fastidiosa]
MLIWALACAVAAVVLGIAVGEGPTAVDTWIAARLGGPSALWDTLSLTTHPVATLSVIAATVVLARRRLSVALMAAAGPAIAVALNTWALKPAFGRVHGDHLAYPSGHTTALAAILAVLVIAAGPRWIAAAIPLIAVAGAAIVGMGYHYATDILGGALWASAVVTFLWGTLARRPRERDATENAAA